ncbi:MAG: hypothetical protein COA78_10830 [Blastopirellula sp.]|nr:MAG: hypothetical protein COA78_10830 [Blastopirellula sp.]
MKNSTNQSNLALRLVFGLMLAILLFSSSAHAQKPKSSTNTVQIVIDYNDGVEKHFTVIPWKAKMTVLDAMKHAEKHPRGVKLKYRGSGSIAFLTEIDGLKNTGSGKNWIFRVNGEKAEKSFGAAQLKSGDTVLWRFELYQ